jgi:cell division protease FtsH
MAQQTPRPNRERDPNGSGAPEPNFNWRGLILFAAAIALIGGAFYLRTNPASVKDVPYPEFVKALDQERIHPDNLKIISEAGSPTDSIRGILLKQKGDSARRESHSVRQFILSTTRIFWMK